MPKSGLLLLKGDCDPLVLHVLKRCTHAQVSEEDAKKALNEQYGGEDNTSPGAGLNTFKFTKYSNAYMLVYVRKSDWDQVLLLGLPATVLLIVR